MSTMRKNSERNKADSKLITQSSSIDVPPLPETFHYSNGDEYTGGCTIIKEKPTIVMQGRGIYTTSDGQTYEGIWENDYLKEECKITFPDESVFTGGLNEMVITGSGKYLFKENVEIEGNFVGNYLTGDVFLKDPNGNYWKGKADENVEVIDFYPYHPFWQEVLHSPSKSYPLFYGEAEEDGLWDKKNEQ